ncbi:MAG: TIGR00730 family Rossman fold protein [Prolixibacteraceae bacterium]|nr:TIGR00730 family Rossman fold protein [Prolixibacteraceae bacterium]
MNICVYCSSSNAVKDLYFKAAEELGKLIGNRNHSLIFGGANVGLMEHLASTVKLYNGHITGIIPLKIHNFQLTSDKANEIVITETMDERKALMRDKSDAFIALPGGFGTLEEILEVITLKQLDYLRKPIVFININGYFNDLLNQFEKSYSETFAKESYRKIYKITSTPEEAILYIENYEHELTDNKWFKVPVK